MAMKRRTFLKTGCAAACAGLFPGSLWFSSKAMASGGQSPVLVYLFLRGGIDGLHLVVPYAGPERAPYESLRVNGNVNLAIPEDRLRQISPQWALHPRMGGEAGDSIDLPGKWLHRRFDRNQLAIVQSVGIKGPPNRSHFDAQAFWDLGTPGSVISDTGWLSRYLQVKDPLPAATFASGFGFAGSAQNAWRGSSKALIADRPAEFAIDGFHWGWGIDDSEAPGHQAAYRRLQPMWAGEDSDHIAYGQRTVEAIDSLRSVDFLGYQPSGGAVYPDNALGEQVKELGDQLKNLAQLIKLDSGLVAATLNYGGWDNHADIGMPQPGNPGHIDPYGERVEGLSRALDAFYTDLENAPGGNLMNRVIVAVVSEFGRRVRANRSAGTDHGYGNMMMLMGGGVQGGLHGTFTGLDSNSLVQGVDLDVSTDYRQVLAEAMVARGNVPSRSLGQVFPEMDSYTPLGLFT